MGKIKVLLVGAFGFDTMDTGGQPVKSRELYYALLNKPNEFDVDFIETKNWKKKPFKLLASYFSKAKKSNSIIMLPAHNGLFVFSFLLCLSKILWKKNIFYNVIGGWLVEKVAKYRRIARRLRLFDGIWVETNKMKEGLKQYKICSTVVPNFKSIEAVSIDEIICLETPPFHICYFSRVMREKGIETAIATIRRLNEEGVKYCLDIYGNVDYGYKDTFFELLKDCPDYIRYLGCADSRTSVSILKHYFVMVFPTFFYTEGVPGAIVDAMFSGLPVICSKWSNFDDVIDDGKTGIGYAFNDKDGLYAILKRIYNEPNIVNSMRKNCVEKSHQYTPEHALSLMNIQKRLR